jgi:hypothetical protein
MDYHGNEDLSSVKRFLDSFVLRRRASNGSIESAGDGHGLFLFDAVPEALAAEKVLAAGGYETHLVAPPQHLRAGCDLAVSVASFERPGAERALADAGVQVRGWVDTPAGSMALADLVTTVDYGEELMVRAGNMKICVRKSDGVIVNTSGGGCPDIPYLNLELVGRPIAQVPRPKELGFTLCGLMLDRAYVEALRLTEEAS